MTKLIHYIGVSILLLASGCQENKTNISDEFIPEISNIDITENIDPHFFELDHSLVISNSVITKIEELLKKSRANGIDNIGFLIISPKPVSIEHQDNIGKTIISSMYKFGFMDSRIVNSGVCIYKDARPGIRINILKYNLKNSDCSKWSEHIGDMNSEKSLPKMGVAGNYNFEQMIANPADLISPRKYKGAKVLDAISAAESSGSAGSESSGSSGSSSGSSGSSSGSSGSSSGSSNVSSN